MIRCYADNLAVVFEPEAKLSAGGLHIPDQAKRDAARWAQVMAVGPGHTNHRGVLIPTTVKAGQFVLVDRLAGQDYAWDLNVPRQNKKGCGWEEEGREWRMVREDECIAVMDPDDFEAMRDG